MHQQSKYPFLALQALATIWFTMEMPLPTKMLVALAITTSTLPRACFLAEELYMARGQRADDARRYISRDSIHNFLLLFLCTRRIMNKYSLEFTL